MTDVEKFFMHTLFNIHKWLYELLLLFPFLFTLKVQQIRKPLIYYVLL